MFLTARNIKDEKCQRSLLLYQAGARISEMFAHIPDHGEEKDYKTAEVKLIVYFQPQ